MIILGITHPISWNTAAVLLEDGKILGAAEEERFVRIKHAPRLIPFHAIEYVLQEAGINYNDVNIIAIGWEGPHNEDEINSSITDDQIGAHTSEAEIDFLIESVEREKLLMNFLRHRFNKSKIFFVKHHLAHAASACYLSGFDRSLFLTIDGRGESESGLIGIFENQEMEVIRKLDLNESLGNLYAKFTTLIGLRGHTDEGKMMGLAPYGKPIYSLLDIAKTNENGKIEINWRKIDSLYDCNFTGDDPTKDERKNFAATAQYLLEKCVLEIVDQLTKTSGISNMCLAGGCALNIDMNGSILSSGLVKDIFIQPASHDAGCALGAALYIHHQFSSIRPEPMRHAYLGPKLNEQEIKEYLDNSGLKYKTLADIPSEIATLLSENKIIGWIQGKSEFGPRALGSRSLLANPADPKMWKLVNQAKGREFWRPLAPSVIEEEVSIFFSNHGVKSPFMLLRFNVKEDKINEIPSVVHVDKSARPQTVSKNTNDLYWNLLKEFEKIQGVPILINTSLNLRGEPLVNSIQDGVKTLLGSEMDYLCVDKFLVFKQ